jgi:glycosyltransferase involved in cell wall biosynthesis
MSQLPAPPPGKTGWPWNEESRRLPAFTADRTEWSRISVVTPSFNQGMFLEATIRSVLLQGYPNLEYFVIDGGSTDGSVEVIKKYAAWLTYWISQPDRGQSDAINRGLKQATGEFATWINSDDLLAKNAFVEHALVYGFTDNIIYVGNCIYIDAASSALSLHRARIHSLEDLVRIDTIWYAGGHIVQPEVLFPRKLALAVGGLNPDNHYTMDYELWGKFFFAGASFHYTDIPFGMFRTHRDQKTADGLRIAESLIKVATHLTGVSGLPEQTKEQILASLSAYWQRYPKQCWKASGRLAKLGLPPAIVNPIRKARAKLRPS